MYIYYSIGNNSEPQTLVRIVEVSVIGESVFGGYTVAILTGITTKVTNASM